MAVGAYATPVYYMEAKRQQAQAMMDAKEVIKRVGAEFAAMTGRQYGLIEKYMMDDAEMAIIIIGSSAGTAKQAILELRAQGGPHQNPLFPSVPRRGDRRGAEGCESFRRHGQG